MLSLVYLTVPTLYISTFLVKFRSSLVFYLLIMVLILLVFSIRGSILPDYESYRYIFDNYSFLGNGTEDSVISRVEPIYGILNEFFRWAFDDFEVFIIAILFASVLIKYFGLISTLGIIGLYAFSFYLAKIFVFNELITLRQGFAMSFTLLAFLNYSNDKWKMSVALMFVAVNIHFASIIFLVMYFHSVLKWITQPKMLILTFVVFTVFNLVDVLVTLIYNLGYLPDILYYYYYVSNETSEGSSLLSLQSIIKTSFSVIIYIYYYRVISKLEIKNIRLVSIALFLFSVSIYFRVIFYSFPILGGRGSSILGMLECIIAGIVFHNVGKYEKIMVFLYYLSLLLGTLIFGDVYTNFKSIL